MSWVLYVLECKAIERLGDQHGWKLEDIEYIRIHGTVAIPCDNPRAGRKFDYWVRGGEGGIWHIVPKDSDEEQAFECLHHVGEIRDAIRVGDPYTIASLAWWFGYNTATHRIDLEYGSWTKSAREVRDEKLTAQIRYWLNENPKVKNSVMARRFQEDPQYEPLVRKFKDLRMFISRLRRKNGM